MDARSRKHEEGREMAAAARRCITRWTPQNSVLFVCDMQEKFRPNIQYFTEITQVSRRLIETAKILGMKTVVTEQYPKGLGHTVPELKEVLPANTPIYDKTKFSMCAPLQPSDLEGIKNVLIVGIEGHVCVLQTTYDLLEKGLDVHVIVDGVSSRSRTDRKYAFKQMSRAGANLTTSECVILGLLGGSDHPQFREVQKLIMQSAPDTGLVHKI